MQYKCILLTTLLSLTLCKSQFYSTYPRIVYPDDRIYQQIPKEPRNIYRNTFQDETSEKKGGNSNLIPKSPECGPIAFGTKIYGGEEAELGEFAWLANLEYRKGGNPKLVSECAGSIINHRYILTAAHCIIGEIEQKVGNLVSVRVGDHNTATTKDCNSNGCIEPFQRLGIEKVIVHPEYRRGALKNTYRDIALIRTDRDIRYTDSVAPVCLPDEVSTLQPLRSGQKLKVAGWGHTGLERQSAVKRVVEVPYVENQKCPFPLDDGHLCVEGIFNKGSCFGDSGGSLARFIANAWYIEGIVSYGRKCGLEIPSVYTRVETFLPWIRENVVP